MTAYEEWGDSFRMKLGYAIVYVPEVSESLRFFEKAFGLGVRFLHESGDYGELDTGETVLAFAAHELGASNLPGGYVRASESEVPLGFQVALVTDDVEGGMRERLRLVDKRLGGRK